MISSSDIESLRQKYSSYKADSTQVSHLTHNQEGELNVKEDKEDKLKTLVICSECYGRGMVDVHYNFQVNTLTCKKCEGDGVMKKVDFSTSNEIKDEKEDVPPLE